MSEAKWFLRTQDETFGPETEARLVEWAKLGRIQPGQEISDDNVIWQRVEDVPFLDMRFSIDIGDGNPRGPFNRAAAEALLASGRLPPISSLVEVRAPFGQEDRTSEPENPPAETKEAVREVKVEVPVEKIVEKIVEKRIEVPVEKIVEKIVEVPVEKIVEKIVEVPVEKIVEKTVEIPVDRIVEKEVIREIPVEKIVEKEKIVVDETRVKELEVLLAEERRHTGELQARMDENAKKSSDAARTAAEREADLNLKLQKQIAESERLAADVQAHVVREEKLEAEAKEGKGREEKLTAALKDAVDRENKYVEQVQHLEDELRRLPQAASEVAEIQAAMFGLMSGESEDIAREIELEKKEFEEVRRRYAARAERLAERRRELLKRSGGDVGTMTHKALIERPEDPRTTQLRKELDELRHTYDRSRVDYETRIRELTEQMRVDRAEFARRGEGLRDVTQLQAEAQQLREQLQRAEKDLMSERQLNETMRQREAANQQALMTRLAALETPSIGTSSTLATNQSREAKQVKLPSWMRLRK